MLCVYASRIICVCHSRRTHETHLKHEMHAKYPNYVKTCELSVQNRQCGRDGAEQQKKAHRAQPVDIVNCRRDCNMLTVHMYQCCSMRACVCLVFLYFLLSICNVHTYLTVSCTRTRVFFLFSLSCFSPCQRMRVYERTIE